MVRPRGAKFLTRRPGARLGGTWPGALIVKRHDRARPSKEEPVWLLFSPTKANLHMRLPFLQYLGPTNSINQLAVPGSTMLLATTSAIARNSKGALFHWITELHRLGYSLNGAFDVHSFYIDHTGMLKGSYILTSKLWKATVRRKSRDMFAVGMMILQIVYGALDDISVNQLPSDILHFVSILKNYNEAKLPLLKMHASHGDEVQQSQLFVRCYNLLEVIKNTDLNGYASIVQRIGFNPNWILLAIQNSYVHRLLRFGNGSRVSEKLSSFLSGEVTYGPDVDGVLRCRRNGEAHLPKDYCLDKDNSEIGYEAAMEILSAFNPGVAAAVNPQQPGPAQLAPSAITSTFPKPLARAMGQAMNTALQAHSSSYAVAFVAAVAAGTAVATHPRPLKKGVITNAATHDAANAAALAAAYLPAPPPVPAQGLPRIMFEDHQVHHILSSVSEDLVFSLQAALFDANKLTGEHWNSDSTAVLLM